MVPLSFGQRDSTIENTLQFAANFSINFNSSSNSNSSNSSSNSSELMCPFLEKLFNFLLNHHNAKEPAVRFRICHFLNILLHSMGEDACIDDTLCDKITASMMDRLLDKCYKVRAQAVFALHRLQDPSDENCPIIKMYIYHLSKDPKIEVRKAVLSSMAKNQKTLHAALERIRDNPVTTGRTQRQIRDHLLKAVDAEIGTEVSILMLNVFLKNRELEKLIVQIPIDESTKLIPINTLTSENSLYWRCVANHLHSIPYTEALEQILPELSTFSAYINEFLAMMSAKQYNMLEKHTHKFILLQLFEIIKIYDLSDEAGRCHLRELILNMLLTDHCSREIIECVVKYLENVMPDVNERTSALADIISKIRMPTTVATQVIQEEKISAEEEHEINMQKAKIRVRLLELKEEQYEAAKSKEYLKAGKLEGEINELLQELDKFNVQPEADMITQDDVEKEKDDPETMIKCLTIICSMMTSKSVTSLTPTLKCLMNIVLTSLDHPDDKVHILALEALGICCILDVELAKTHIWTFLLQFSLEQETQEIWTVTLKAILDLLLLHGIECLGVLKNVNDNNTLNESEKTERTVKLYNRKEDESITTFDQSNKEGQHPDIIKILMGLMDNEDKNLRTIAIEGFCKLLVNCRINSSTVLVRIIIMYYNPVSSDDAYLRQCISSFFNQFVQKVPYNQEMLEETFFPILRILCNAPDSSPLQEINPYDVAMFILNLTRNREGSKMYTYRVHNSLAFAILAEILNPNSKIDKHVLIKCLRNLHLEIDDNVAQQNLEDGTEKLLLMVKKFDKRLIPYVENFQQKLKSPGATSATKEAENDDMEDAASRKRKRDSNSQVLCEVVTLPPPTECTEALSVSSVGYNINRTEERTFLFVHIPVSFKSVGKLYLKEITLQKEHEKHRRASILFFELRFTTRKIIERCEGVVENSHVTPPVPSQLSVETGVDEVDNPDYQLESARLQSFRNWPVTFVEPTILATAGFYYTGEADKVRCFECQEEICQWEPDVPAIDRIRHSQRCHFIKNISCGDVPMDISSNTMSTSRSSTHDVCGPYNRQCQRESIQNEHQLISSLNLQFPSTTKLASLGLERPKSPVHPDYISYDARLRTFDTWPKSMPQSKEQLANAGFFYTGKSDQTLCYHCGEGLKDWEPQDDPWEEHAKWFPRCYYLLMVKGQEYVNAIRGEDVAPSIDEETMQMNLASFVQSVEFSSTNKISKNTSLGNSSTSNSRENCVESSSSSAGCSKESTKDTRGVKAHKPTDDARLCKICYDAELDVVFLPCRHMVTCVKCASAMTTCAVCRQPVTLILRAILS
ncbi:hypothetical protein KPH14_004672 [Odynerus spinipes]|uniref:RING-type domain-containing protein n=1 Tax=Odynerus spinipes TaxID=1348599 RepID=A0AAD9VQH8_9HYME|nr:hypothetical protein KPH14_004672 [Odynerus spinipes]